jgi:hypothetical protein
MAHVYFQNKIIIAMFFLMFKAWLWLFFKVFFILKYIKMIFFLFFKNYFWDQRIKTIQNIKKLI